MRAAVIFTVWCFLTFCIGGNGYAGEISREPLDQLWKDHMLAGTPGGYYGGEETDFVSEKSVASSAGNPGEAAFNKYGISVQDIRGTTWLGLFQGGGWSLEGGLIGRVELDHSTLELYGKRVWHYYPGLLGITHYAKYKEEEQYEFFLLKRETGAKQATVLKKWVIPPTDVFWFVPGREHETDIPEHVKKQSETRDVRGFLKYIPESQEAEVTFTGLTHPMVEHIPVP